MAAITDLTTLAVANVAANDYIPINDASAGTDKKTALYESGTWTPTLKFGGATTGITYSVRIGTYTRIGRIVIAAASILLSNKGSATGIATVDGLPYAALSNANSHFYAGSVYWRNMAANGYSIMALLPDASSTITVYVASASANTGGATDAAFSNTSELFVTIVYEAA